MGNRLSAELIAECFGTFILIAFGNGVVAMVSLFGHSIPGEVVNGGFTNVTLAWGLGVTMAIYLTGRISGAHLNPAVTLALAVYRGFPWSKVLPYSLAQITGAFFGAALVYLNYRPAFLQVDPSLLHTAGVFTTFPTFPGYTSGFVDQVIGTALLMLLISGLGDPRNFNVPSWSAPVFVGLSVVLIGMAFGGMHGYAINPARDFGPRLFTVVAGFRNNGLTDGTWHFIVPLVAPLLGALIGAGAYDLFIRKYLPAETTAG